MLSLLEYGYWLQTLDQHRRNARLTRAALLDLQQRKFRRLVRYAGARSPYYRELIRRLRLNVDTCRPEDFPVLNRSDLIERFDDLVTDRSIRLRDVLEFVHARRNPHERFQGRYRIAHTTGTTGTRVHMVYTPWAWVQASALSARTPFPHLGRRRRVAALLPSSPGFTSVQLTSSFERGPSSWFADVRIFPIEWEIARLIDELNRFQPDSVSGYVIHLKLLGEARESGDLRISPVQITTGGGQLKWHDRLEIERAFGCRVRNNYACTEALYLGLSMEESDDFTLQEDAVHFEVHPTHVCLTPLNNFTVPLIRYRMDDALTLTPQTTEPGQAALPALAGPFQRVQNVVGRQDWTLMFHDRNGKQGVLTFPSIDRLSLPGVTALQAVQESESSLTLRVQFSGSLDGPAKRRLQERLEAMLRDMLRTLCLEGVSCRVCESDDLHRTPTGKVRNIVPFQRAA